ncbi:MAG: type ISP restriction/modification enzyme [bacterium]
MVDVAPLKSYLDRLEGRLVTGDTTEHTHRSTLEILIECFGDDIKAINEPKRIECGAPDLAVLRDGFMVGHIEAKDVGASLDAAERSDQLKRYRRSLPNLILTDYLEFRWYVDGDHRRTVKLGRFDADGHISVDRAGKQNVAGLLCDFLAHKPEPIGTARELAERLARLTHLIRDIIVTAFEKDKASDLLTDWRKAFAEVLVPELDEPENVGQFADMFAQTLAYGLFSARILHERGTFTRQRAQGLIPKTNPFLRDLFYYITGPRLEDEPYAGLVEDLVQLLALADMHAVLADFGKRTRQEDPTLHFYETFLAAYDPELRDRRGVRYTPNPVVSYIVRSVDILLKDKFGLPRGLADTTRLPDGTHKLLLLDPACGTATFLYGVIDLIREDFMKAENAGMWAGYVRDHLLPRIFGFELLMAPYAVAHFKLALQLAGHDLSETQQPIWAYDFKSDERNNVYLTNTLEAPEHDFEQASLFGSTRIVAEEAQAANVVKKDLPIMVVLGNPPYAGHSANDNPWIDGLLKGELPDGTKVRSYYEVDGHPLRERNTKWLQDDYVKFIRFAQRRIDQTGGGILAFITNNGYLDNPTFRGMRQALMESFNEIYVLDLHGNARKGEVAPDGSPDENVFDIMQGVAIGIMVRTSGQKSSTVYHAHSWGAREAKYARLVENDISTIEWQELSPASPFYLFIPQETDLRAEYQEGRSLEQLTSLRSIGMNTHRDGFAIAFEPSILQCRISDLVGEASNDTLRERYGLNDTYDFSLSEARHALRSTDDRVSFILPCVYRPFDFRFIVYHPSILDRPRRALNKHFVRRDNVGLVTTRQTQEPFAALVTSQVCGQHKIVAKYDGSYVFPLYLYPDEDPATLFDNTATSPWQPDPNYGNRVPNLSEGFVEDFEERLGIFFDPHKTDTVPGEIFGPRDGLAYIYAVFHSPTYRERYAEFLKIDFPRVPLTSDEDLFWNLVELGSELIDLHLMDHPKLAVTITSFPVPGDNRVKPRGGYPKFIPAGESRTKTSETAEGNRVYIN